MEKYFKEIINAEKPREYKMPIYELDRAFRAFTEHGNLKICSNMLKDILSMIDQLRKKQQRSKVTALIDLYTRCSIVMKQKYQELKKEELEKQKKIKEKAANEKRKSNY